MFDLLTTDEKLHYKKITGALLYAIFAFFILVNGESLLGYWSTSWTANIIIYLIGVMFFIISIDKLPEDLKKTSGDRSLIGNILGFLIAFPVFTCIYILISDAGIWFVGIENLAQNMVISTMIFQIGIVALSEEIIFRAVVFKTFTSVHRYLAFFLSSLLFGLFHYASYGGNWTLIFVAMTMGFILAVLYDRYNLGVAVGFHASYNCFVAGATYLMINLCW